MSTEDAVIVIYIRTRNQYNDSGKKVAWVELGFPKQPDDFFDHRSTYLKSYKIGPRHFNYQAIRKLITEETLVDIQYAGNICTYHFLRIGKENYWLDIIRKEFIAPEGKFSFTIPANVIIKKGLKYKIYQYQICHTEIFGASETNNVVTHNHWKVASTESITINKKRCILQ